MRLILIADDIFLLVDLKTLCNSLIESALLCCILSHYSKTCVKVTSHLRGCPSGKNSYAR